MTTERRTLPSAPEASPKGPPEPVADWRETLRAHAAAVVRRAALHAGMEEGPHEEGPHLAEPSPPDAHRAAILARLQPGLGPLAAEALDIVEAFALGARARAARNAGPSGAPPEGAPTLGPEYLAQLEIVLAGLSPQQAPCAPDAAASPQIIQSELWQLLYKVRESADLCYAREIDLVELDRRILLLLRATGPQVPASIAGATGVDKAQVSRSVKRLLEIKVVEREQIRAPLALSRKGRALSDRLVRLAELRNRELTLGIADEQIARFRQVIGKLLQRAVALYEQEHARCSGEGGTLNPFPIDPSDRPGQPVLLDRSRIISPLMTLSAYFSRSGSLAFKRLTGLSNFETWVLNEIGRDPPMEWPRLVERLDRDHSQAGRTVRALIERALVERQGRPGRRHGRFSLTARGQAMFDIIQNASRQRSAFLMAPLTREERTEFLATFGQIHHNALVQLERERTFGEIG